MNSCFVSSLLSFSHSSSTRQIVLISDSEKLKYILEKLGSWTYIFVWIGACVLLLLFDGSGYVVEVWTYGMTEWLVIGVQREMYSWTFLYWMEFPSYAVGDIHSSELRRLRLIINSYIIPLIALTVAFTGAYCTSRTVYIYNPTSLRHQTRTLARWHVLHSPRHRRRLLFITSSTLHNCARSRLHVHSLASTSPRRFWYTLG